MRELHNIWVFAEKKEALAELCAGGRLLGGKVSVILIGSKDEADQALRAGADHVYWLGEKDSARMTEDYTLSIANLIEAKRPDVFLFSATKRCKLIAGRLAARFGTSVLTDVMEFVTEADSLLAKRMVYGGAAIRTERSASQVILATLGVGIFEKLSEEAVRQGEIEEVAFVQPDHPIKRLERKSKQGESVNLAAAKKVVTVGRGIAKQEDLKLIETLAGLIGAEIGCTRPMAEGVNWLPRERYIGVSGVMFKPEIYIGIGISGQIQHMVGCNQARTIVAINKDKAAPIFNQADYGIVGDLYKVVPLLIEKLKEH